MIIGPDSPFCERLKAGFGKRAILLNTSESDFILLQPYDSDQMASLIAAFRIEQASWLRTLMTSKTSEIDGKKAKSEGIYGASVYIYAGAGSAFRFLNLNKLPEEARAILYRVPPRPGQHELSRVFNFSTSEARKFVRLALGSDIKSMLNVLDAAAIEQFIFPELETRLQNMGADSFLSWIANYCTENYWATGRAYSPKSHVPFLFMLFLHRKGIVLFPIASGRKHWSGIGIPNSLWLTSRRERLFEESLRALEVVSNGYG